METDPDAGKEAYQWQQDRRRADGVFGTPCTGFGPGGGHTLWLTPAAAAPVWGFEGGRPKLLGAEGPAVDEPEIDELRRQTLATIRGENGVIVAPGLFLGYASAVIRRNYRVTDADLALLLLHGTKWHQGMVAHLVGGKHMVAALAGYQIQHEDAVSARAAELAAGEPLFATGEPEATGAAPEPVAAAETAPAGNLAPEDDPTHW
jgi:hypothetical protein